MKNVKQAQTYFYRVILDTVTDVTAFHRTAASCKGEVYLVGEDLKISAKSLLGAHLARVAWDKLYVEADFDCYGVFKKFIV